MSKILHFFNILIIYCGCFVFFLFFSPSLSVQAAGVPFVSVPGGSCSNSTWECSSTSSFFYFYYNGSINFCAYSLDSSPNWVLNRDGSDFSFASGSRSYSKIFDGVTYNIYYRSFSISGGADAGFECAGTEVYNQNDIVTIINYFLFGEGSLEYNLPAQDIEDSDLDIVGLIGSSSSSIDTDPSTLSGFMSNFVKNVLNLFSGGLFAGSLGSGDIFSSSVPSCRLVWDSPSVSTINDYGDSSTVSYSIWVDGKCKITLYQVGEWVDGTSCSFSHLVLHDAPILYNGVSTFYYSTGSAYQTILNYVLNNSSFPGGTSISEAQQSDIKLETCISRIYIQAHRVDVNGDNHIGAISYVDFSSGYPVVYEGVTDSIEDIIPDDSGNGSNTVVTQPFVVSGDSIVYGDTITENNTTNNYYGEGLIIGGNIPFLNAAYWLIQAVLELIKTLYASLLVPFIVLGWTGHL